MKTKVMDAGPVRVLSLEGKLMLGNGDGDLEKAMDALLTEGHKKIVIDTAGVSHLDSGGLGAMVAYCFKRAKDRQATVRLVIPGNTRINLAAQTCLGLLFELHDNETSAIASL
jgi:anti-anti-sigma factor